MHPARFVTFLFFYAGTMIIIQAGLGFGSGLELSLYSALQASVGLIIAANAPARMRKPIEEQTPSEYGPFIYVLIALCFVLTVLTAGSVYLVVV